MSKLTSGSSRAGGTAGDGGAAWRVAVGKRVAEARLAEAYRRGKEFTQAELAELTGVSALTISRIEAGERGLRAERGGLFASALRCDLGWLMDGPPKPGVYAGRGSINVAAVSEGDAAPARPGRGPRKRGPKTRAKLPAMYYGEPALTNTPIDIRRRREA